MRLLGWPAGIIHPGAQVANVVGVGALDLEVIDQLRLVVDGQRLHAQEAGSIIAMRPTGKMDARLPCAAGGRGRRHLQLQPERFGADDAVTAKPLKSIILAKMSSKSPIHRTYFLLFQTQILDREKFLLSAPAKIFSIDWQTI